MKFRGQLKEIRLTKKCILMLTFSYIMLTIISCTMLANGSSIISGEKSIPIETNFTPPELLDVSATEENCVEFQFTEPVTVEGGVSFQSINTFTSTILTTKRVEDDKRIVKIIFQNNTLPGINYRGKVSFLDQAGNNLGFIVSFYGYNPNLPDAVINELRINGSASDPVRDTVEIYFKTGGNPGGMTLYIGTKNSPSNSFTFPSMSVEAGDYVLLHCFPDTASTGVPEVSGKNSAVGIGFSPYAYDFQMSNDKGLSGTNGVVTLYTSPGGNPIDGIIYTNRTGDPADAKLGWTSTIFPVVQEFASEGFWNLSGGDPLPDLAVWSGNVGASKRTLCRNSFSIDTNKKDDWHTTPTNNWSLGFQNSNTVY